METWGTFIFCLFILYVTGKKTKVPDLVTWGIPAICLLLWALIQVDAYSTASFNPALAIGQTICQMWWWPTSAGGALINYLPWYILSAYVGGALAGAFYLGFEKHFPDPEQPVEQATTSQIEVVTRYMDK